MGVAELHFSGHGWRWGVTGMEVRCKYQDLDWGETWPGWSWDFNMHGCLYGGEMWIWGPGLNWDATSMEERCKVMDLDGDGSWMKARQESCDLNFVEQDQDGSLTHILKPGCVSDGAWVDLRCNLGGLEWRWNITLLLFRGKYMDLDWGDTWSGWGGDVNLGA